MLREIKDGADAQGVIHQILREMNEQGPINPARLEQLAYLKRFQKDLLARYETKLLSLMGLFYKTQEPDSVLEQVYNDFKTEIEAEVGRIFTPVQAHAYRNIREKKYFSFSAPTSAGKSHLFRELIQEAQGDIVIVVPSRALIAEYMSKVMEAVDKRVLVLQFIENVNTKNITRRIFVITPERGVELFRQLEQFNIELFLLDEAQLVEESIRGMRFDAFVRRIDRALPEAKKVFAHPFVDNPDAQLLRHNFVENGVAIKYEQLAVGKIFAHYHEKQFTYFSPYGDGDQIKSDVDIAEEVLKKNGTLLIYIAKHKIYEEKHLTQFAKYIELCKPIRSRKALATIERLKNFIGANDDEEKHSMMVEMMRKGIVIHHGSMPLKARYIVEEFIKEGYARICFSTSTLVQGINMPFDAVWIDNFQNMKPLVLKNLVGRSGRTTNEMGAFDYGYTIVKKSNVKTLERRYAELVTLSEESALDKDLGEIPEDLKDIVEAIREEGFDDELYLTRTQIQRIEEKEIDDEIRRILDNLLRDNKPLTGRAYYELPDENRKEIKEAFRNIYIAHLRKEKLTRAESGILSAAIPIMLWRVQGKSFSEIVSLRHSFFSERTARRRIRAEVRGGRLTEEEGQEQINNIKIRYSPVPVQLPDADARAVPLFSTTSSVEDLDFDTLVYDTYDYLDKVIGFSLSDPLCAAFLLYSARTQDERGEIMSNYIRYGTNDEVEIWLIRYGFGFEDIEWLREYVLRIDQEEIVFDQRIRELSDEQRSIIDRYI